MNSASPMAAGGTTVAGRLGYKVDGARCHARRLAIVAYLDEYGALPPFVVSGFLQKSVGAMFFNGAMAFFGIVVAWLLPSNALFGTVFVLLLLQVLRLVFSSEMVDKAVSTELAGAENIDLAYQKLIKTVAKHTLCVEALVRSAGAPGPYLLLLGLALVAYYVPLPVLATTALLLFALFPVYTLVTHVEPERFLASPPVSPRLRAASPRPSLPVVPDE
ncbi:hypothetical protein GMRT_10548 [Giardia muris]|uniref:Uncharacterized protein n=1 Tax=Giardia muris TaxID=5742 RepID=A0A4Z1SMF3_GIAMU|nr:hypothetical protein GMRT_10548 [Giardia muris]|eukprot:TNJ26872.1 hypothetical protein GMRT_10548 [Giardia muris]